MDKEKFSFMFGKFFVKCHTELYQLFSSVEGENALKAARIIRALAFGLARRAEIKDIREIIEKQDVLEDKLLDLICNDIEDSIERCIEVDAQTALNPDARLDACVNAVRFTEFLENMGGQDLVHKAADAMRKMRGEDDSDND